MTELHLDARNLTINFFRNTYQVEVDVFLQKDSLGFNLESSEREYDVIYIAVSFERCLVLLNARITAVQGPRFEGLLDLNYLQLLSIHGRDINMITMEYYNSLKK